MSEQSFKLVVEFEQLLTHKNYIFTDEVSGVKYYLINGFFRARLPFASGYSPVENDEIYAALVTMHGRMR